jgi:branched-chain amino acid aminotransferase
MKATPVLVNGRILPPGRPAIPAADRALFPGLGLFETMRVYGGRAYLLDEHLARMRRGARVLGLRLPFPAARVARDVARLLRVAGAREAALRLVLTSGAPGVAPSLVAAIEAIHPPPDDLWTRGARLEIAPCVQDPRSPLAGVKSLNYLERRLIRGAARARGAYEAVYLGPDGRVLEGTSSNLFAVIGGRVTTPPLVGILPGVTRAHVLRLLGGVRERPLRPADLARASEVFLTSSLAEVLPVSRVGTIRLPRRGFPVARELARRYREEVAEFIRGENQRGKKSKGNPKTQEGRERHLAYLRANSVRTRRGVI